MFERVLIPTDGSDGMDRVAERAIALAELCEAEVHALYVVDDRAYGSVPEEARERIRDTLEEDGHDATKAIAERAVDVGLSVSREVRWGDPATTIVTYAVESDVDVVVMGTRGPC